MKRRNGEKIRGGRRRSDDGGEASQWLLSWAKGPTMFETIGLRGEGEGVDEEEEEE